MLSALPLILLRQEKVVLPVRPAPSILYVAGNSIGLTGPQLFNSLKAEYIYVHGVNGRYKQWNKASQVSIEQGAEKFATPNDSNKYSWLYQTASAGWPIRLTFSFEKGHVLSVEASPETAADQRFGQIAARMSSFLAELQGLDRDHERAAVKSLLIKAAIYADDTGAHEAVDQLIAKGDYDPKWIPDTAYVTIPYKGASMVMKVKPVLFGFLYGKAKFNPAKGNRDVIYTPGALHVESSVLSWKIAYRSTQLPPKEHNMHLRVDWGNS